MNIKPLSIESFKCTWCGKIQPVGSFTREAVKEYIINEINSGRATLSQFGVYSNYGNYNVAEFINPPKNKS